MGKRGGGPLSFDSKSKDHNKRESLNRGSKFGKRSLSMNLQGESDEMMFG